MIEGDLLNIVILPLALGLLGFIEPCTMGSNLLFIKYVEGKNGVAKIAEVGVYTVTRAVFIGALGAGAALVGSVFIGVQKGAWLFLGSVYIMIGALFLIGRAGGFVRSIGPSLRRVSGVPGSAGLGLLFGLNVPACAAPLIFVLLGSTAVGAGANVAKGFLTLALFGLALSLPLLLALSWDPARRVLDRLAGLSVSVPFWTGLVFIGIGLWSVYFGLFVNLEDWV